MSQPKEARGEHITQLIEDIGCSLGTAFHAHAEHRRKHINDDDSILAMLCDCVSDFIEMLYLRIPRNLHPCAQEIIHSWHRGMRASFRNHTEVLRLSRLICERVVQELTWEAENAASALDFRHAYRLQRQAERFEATHAAITKQIEAAANVIRRTATHLIKDDACSKPSSSEANDICRGTARRAMRRRRRSNLRYRPARFNNRTKPKAWLPPSLQHRVNSTMSWVERLRRLAPVTGIAMELVRFDMQKMENPEISGVEYQQGTLAGYEVKEYLLEKWDRACAYCDVTGVPLEVEHIRSKRHGGSNHVSNLTLACVPCNKEKDAQPIDVFLAKQPERLAKIKAQAKRPLKDAAACL